ncbi:MAG: hypothetical protein QOG31_550 [Thermoplasmata archaeon]|jgi:hypothetical protein|nr:hypothetical protein [Thermoplasmata archaeon]
MGTPSRHPQDDAVADTVGSILLVAITVVMATVLGGLLFSFRGPVALPQSSVAVTVSPGNAAWGNGDEQIRVAHNGGEGMPTAGTVIAYSINGVAQPSVTGAAIGSSLYDGATLLPPRTTWAIGQVWVRTLTLQASDTVAINVVSTGGASSLVASVVLVPGQVAAGAACPFDTAAPTVSQWAQSPADVTKNTVGAVAVAATLIDNCAGVDNSNVPHLWWRLRGVATPSFTDAGAMVTQGLGIWTGTIPSQAWLLQAGKVLEYYAAPLKDLQGNSAQSAVQADTVEVDCTADASPPNVSPWGQAPANLASSTAAGAVAITATLADNCWGVDNTATPQLWWRLNDGTNPAYVQAAAMTPAGVNQWQGTIPSQAWNQVAGRTLQYQLQNLKDLGGNTGSSAAASDLVDIVSPTYIGATGITAVVGTVTNGADATAAGGPEASLAETTVTTATFFGTASTGSNSITLATDCTLGGAIAVAADCAAQNDNKHGVLNAVSDVAAASGFWATPPVGAGGITKVMIGVDGRSSSAGTSHVGTLSYTVGGVAEPTTQAGIQFTTATDANLPASFLDVTADRSWTIADIQALRVLFTVTATSTRDVWMDSPFIQVTYAVGGGTGRAMNQQLAFAQVPNSTPGTGSQTLELGYHVTPTSGNDVFNVQVWNPTSTAWRTCPLQLTSTSASPVAYSCVLIAAEYAAGAPLARIVDATPASTTATTVLLDYARVATT